MDYQDGGAVLHRAGLRTAAEKFLGKIRSLSAAGRFKTEEKHPRLLLAYRSGKGHPVASKHRAELALVLHRPPRAGAWLLLQGLLPPRSALLAAGRRRSRI